MDQGYDGYSAQQGDHHQAQQLHLHQQQHSNMEQPRQGPRTSLSSQTSGAGGGPSHPSHITLHPLSHHNPVEEFHPYADHVAETLFGRGPSPYPAQGGQPNPQTYPAPSRVSPLRAASKRRMQITGKVGAGGGRLDGDDQPTPVQMELLPGYGVEIKDDGSFSRGGSYNRRHYVVDKEKQSEEIRKSKELAAVLKAQMEEKEARVQRSLRRDRQEASEGGLSTTPAPFQGSPNVSKITNEPSTIKKNVSVVAPEAVRSSSELSGPAFNHAIKAAPEWLDEPGEPVPNAPTPFVVPASRTSPDRSRLLFDHEKRAEEERERQKQAELKKEELRIFLEQQIREKEARIRAEREAELRLERELEARAIREAELLAEKDKRELEREKANADDDGGPKKGTGQTAVSPPPVLHETSLQRRRRLAEERRQRQGEAGSSQELNPDGGSPPAHEPNPNAVSQNGSPGPNRFPSTHSLEHQHGPNPFERELMLSLEMIQKELLEQRKRLLPLTPAPQQHPPTPIPLNSGTPPPTFAHVFRENGSEPHPAREILERNRSRLSALRYARHHDDILKAFLMEDQTQAMRNYDKFTPVRSYPTYPNPKTNY